MRIAIVQDDGAQAEYIENILVRAGYHCDIFHSPVGFLGRMQVEDYDLLLLDGALRDISGMDVLKTVREDCSRHLLVMMLICRAADEDIAQALNLGADDCIPKPVSQVVLTARVSAMLRRVSGPDTQICVPMTFDRYIFDPANNSVAFGSKVARLTFREFQLARWFFMHPRRAFSRRYLIERVWGKHPDLQTRTLDTHIARIRTKLELRPPNGVQMTTLYGHGYRLELVGKR